MHGLGFLLIIGIRLLVYWSGKRAVQTGRPEPVWLVSLRRSMSIRPIVSRVWGLGLRAIFLLAAWRLWLDGAATGWLIFWLVCGLPRLVIELVLIPAGVPHLAYYFTRVTYPHAVFGEPRGGALFNELRARLRWGWLLEPPALARLGQDIVAFDARGNDRATRASSITARAILDALAGDGERARELFGVVQAMDWRHAARPARVYCQAWLLSDAARRGAYHEVIRLSVRGPFTFRRLFMRGSARRLLGLANAPTNWQLVGSWLLAPARRHTFGLLKLALRAEARSELSPVEPGLAGARRLSFELMRLPSGSVTRDELGQLARTWQAVFDSGEVRGLLTERRQALQGSFDVDTIDARFERQIVARLSELLLTTLPADDSEARSPALMLAAMDQLQGDLLGEFEDLCHSLPRGAARTTDDLEQHWRTWARLRQLASLLSDTLPERAYLIFASVGGVILNHGAWLYNQEKALVLAHDVFRFLLGITPKDDTNWQTIRQNARLSV